MMSLCKVEIKQTHKRLTVFKLAYLFFERFDVVQVDVSVSQGVNKVTRLKRKMTGCE